MKNEEKYQLIEDYLDGNLSVERLAFVQQLIDTDPDFAIDVKLHKDLKDTFGNESVIDLSNKIKKAAHNNTSRSNLNYKTILITLSVISLLIIGYKYLFPAERNNQELFEKFADIPLTQNYDALFIERQGNDETSNKDSEDSLWINYFNLYNENLLDRATEELNNIQSRAGKSIDIQFQRGLVELRKGNFEAAIENFEAAEAGQDMSKWYLSLSYLKLDEVDKAKSKLQEIANSVHPRSDKASQLLALIK